MVQFFGCQVIFQVAVEFHIPNSNIQEFLLLQVLGNIWHRRYSLFHISVICISLMTINATSFLQVCHCFCVLHIFFGEEFNAKVALLSKFLYTLYIKTSLLPDICLWMSLSVCGFFYLNSGFQRENVFNFDELNFFSFYDLRFCIHEMETQKLVRNLLSHLPSQKLLCFIQKLYKFTLAFKTVIHFNLILYVWIKAITQVLFFFSFLKIIQLLQLFFLHLSVHGPFMEIQLTIYMWVCFSTLYSIPLICMFSLTNTLVSFIISFQIK